VITLVFFVVAALAWAVTIARMRSMDDMRVGLGTIEAFVASWTLMLVAMMLPSALPLVFEFARRAERRDGWRTATVLLGMTYLSVWLAFGVVCYVLYNALGMPWRTQAIVGGVALIAAGLYAMSPLKRLSEAHCRELFALHAPLPFNLMRSAVVAGGRYALSCLGCGAALMLAVLLIGTSSLLWMIAFSALMLLSRLAPARTAGWLPLAASAALIASGVLYAASA
jgi:predicted metal-binding membrane protein